MNAPEKIHFTRRQRFEAGKLEKRLCRLAGEAVADYGMIVAGDRVMVCLSGGKDSYGLLDVLLKLRSGALYRVARELGATKIALGHHRDDILETFFLNLFFGGKMKAMSPKLQSDDGNHVVIRPFAYVAESDLEAYATIRGFPIIPCDLCGSQPTLQRKQVKQMLAEWEKRHPGRVDSMFRALSDIVPSHLMDRKLFDFLAVNATGKMAAEGDKAFD